MKEIAIHIQFFGMFRKYGDGLNLSVPVGSTVSAIKSALQSKLDGERLVLDSVIANQDSILRDDAIIDSDAALAILPPVCGG